MIFERNALLGLAAAALWGGGDFTGGMGVKKSGGTVPAALRVVLLGHICSGKAFPKVQLEMMKTTGKGNPETYFTMTMEGAFITKVSNSGTEDGSVVQKVQMVFKTVKIDYKPLNKKDGTLGAVKTYNWDIPAGTASPSA